MFLTSASGGDLIYVPNHDHPRNVLRGVDDSLIAEDLSEAVMVKINKLAVEGLCCFLKTVLSKLCINIYFILKTKY